MPHTRKRSRLIEEIVVTSGMQDMSDSVSMRSERFDPRKIHLL